MILHYFAFVKGFNLLLCTYLVANGVEYHEIDHLSIHLPNRILTI